MIICKRTMSESLQFPKLKVEIQRFGEDFVLLRSGDADGLARLGTALHEQGFDFVEEVIVTRAEILLKLNGRFSPEKIAALVQINPGTTNASERFVLPVCFAFGTDWDEVLKHTGQSRAAYIEAICRLEYRLEMLGFLPGFAYLEGLSAHLQVPRKAQPATRVPAGAIAVGGKYLGLYALESPGGWQVIGQTPLRILRIPALPPVAFRPGDRFRLLAIDAPQFHCLADQGLSFTEYNATGHATT